MRIDPRSADFEDMLPILRRYLAIAILALPLSSTYSSKSCHSKDSFEVTIVTIATATTAIADWIAISSTASTALLTSKSTGISALILHVTL